MNNPAQLTVELLTHVYHPKYGDCLVYGFDATDPGVPCIWLRNVFDGGFFQVPDTTQLKVKAKARSWHIMLDVVEAPSLITRYWATLN